MGEVITSLQNDRVKHLVKLRDRRTREKSQLFLIEGYRELLRAKEGNAEVVEVYFSPEHFLGSNERDLIANFPSIEVSKAVFDKISYRDRPDGLLAIAKQQHLALTDLPKTTHPFYIVAEAIEKPGNLGSMLRSCDAAGADALIICDRCTDIHNPNVVRASVGTLFTVPVIEASTEETITHLKKEGVAILAATPDTKKVYTDVDMKGPIAIIVGTEQHGLSQTWLEVADICVKIPMQGRADSLNVTAAATLLMYEALRQRLS